MIAFLFEDVGYRLRNRRLLRSWLANAVAREGFEEGALTYVFCSDERLREANKQFLGHDYYTDIITFDDSDAGVLSGDMMISVDRVRENARGLNVGFEDEMHRVLAHGALHLAGMKDGTENEKQAMRSAEDRWLALRPAGVNVPRGTR